MNTRIVVIQAGWVFVGREIYDDGAKVKFIDSRCIRVWGTTMGLGELALSGPTSSTVLEPSGKLEVPISSVLFRLDVDETKWAKVFG